MPVSLHHEALVELFRNRPQLALELLPAGTGPLPGEPQDITHASAELNAVAPSEYRADAVIWINTGQGAWCIILEVQLRPDPDKRYVWPAYVVNTFARHRARALLVVLTLDASTRTWATAPISTGHPGFDLRPIVVGSEDIPVVRQGEQAVRAPELAVLSAMAHGQGPDAVEVGEAALEGLRRLDEDRRKLYLDLVLSSLGEEARATLEAQMIQNYEYQSDFVRNLDRLAAQLEREEGRQEGRQEGERLVLTRLLVRRFGPLDADARARLESANAATLEAWADAVLTAGSLDEVLATRP